MPTEPAADNFADNWDYLRTELRWLDQVLMNAVARQKREGQEVDRHSQTRADRATSHWWRGLVSLEGNTAYDEHRQPSSGIPKPSYQQQLEGRIQSSRRKGVLLGLPMLRDRLQLSSFEKNLLLMGLAPEINRRYAKLYRFLEGDDVPIKTDLPSLDLIMRLMCRNDAEWRTARWSLTAPSPLLTHELIRIVPCATDSFLNQPIRLADQLLRYLLAEKPLEQMLDQLIPPASQPEHNVPAESPISLFQGGRDRSLQFLTPSAVTLDWGDLILPSALVKGLKAIAQRLQSCTLLERHWGFSADTSEMALPGAIALFHGAIGTGKTMAAGAIAQTIQVPLFSVDLSLVEPYDYSPLLQEIDDHHPTLLLLKAAHLLFEQPAEQPAALSAIALHRFFLHRRQIPSLTLLSTNSPESILFEAHPFLSQIFEFPLPTKRHRLKLWQKAFPAQVPLAETMDWDLLAKDYGLTGGEIGAIAYEAALLAIGNGSPRVTMSHVFQAIASQV
jgi:ATPase family associated with various cellular activities (AAA)